MSGYEKKQLERQFSRFTKQNFEKPGKCKSVGQVRFYINELSNKIDELKKRFNYVPNAAYNLLSDYNAKHNKLVMCNFQEVYS